MKRHITISAFEELNHGIKIIVVCGEAGTKIPQGGKKKFCLLGKKRAGFTELVTEGLTGISFKKGGKKSWH